MFQTEMASILQRLLFGLSCFLLILPTSSNLSGQTCTSTPNTCCMVNDTAISFDPTRYICCQGKLNPRENPNKLYCCGKVLYSPEASICCNNILSHFNTTDVKPRCCRNVGYDADKFVCCRGVVRKKMADNSGCCAGKELDVTKQICCKGRIQPSTEGSLSCCGFNSFNPHKDTCCNTTVHVNTVTRTCCGSQPFDRSLSTCCNGQLRHKTGLSCCGKKAYNQTTHLCCGDKVKAKEKNNSDCCCSGNSCSFYDKTNQTCCGGRVISKRSHLACCGRDIYDVTLQVCCGTIPLGSNTYWRCCGGKPYNEDVQICCKNNVQPKKSRRTRCCGNKGYEPSQFQCDDFLFSRVTPIKGKFCGKMLYNSDREMCCKKIIARKIYGWSSQCCGKTVYHRRRQICCDGQLAPVPLGLPQCCRTRPYNINEQKCDIFTGDITSRSKSHVGYCGSKMGEYDSRKFRCCGDVIYGEGHICCQGKVKRLPGNAVGNFKCCGEKPHNESFLCCHGNLVSKHHVTSCCGTIGYNSSIHACCQGQVYGAEYTCCRGVVHPTPGTRLDTGKCCRGIGYNNEHQICCKNMIFPKKSKKLKCCGNRPFDPSRNLHTCCHASLSLSSHGKNSCCGSVSFNPNTDTCCRGRVHRGQKQSCCGKNVYDSSKEICCRRIVYPKAKYGSKCCKKLAYNDAKQICQEGKVMTKILCGRKYYDNVTQVCCKDRLHVKSLGYRCCNKQYYDSSNSICCGNKVYPAKTKICCNGRAYSAKLRCCGGEVFKKNSLVQCCSGTRYNRRMFRCKNQRIVVKEKVKRKLCDEQSNVAFVGKVSSVKKHSLMVVQVLKGKQLQINDTIIIPYKQLQHRKVVLQQGKVYFIIGKLPNKSPSTVRHVKICHPWNNKLQTKIQAILKSCVGETTAPKSAGSTRKQLSVTYNRQLQ